MFRSKSKIYQGWDMAGKVGTGAATTLQAEPANAPPSWQCGSSCNPHGPCHRAPASVFWNYPMHLIVLCCELAGVRQQGTTDKGGTPAVGWLVGGG